MTDEEYIRAGVELADGWNIDNEEGGDPDYDYLENAGGNSWHFNEDPMWVGSIPEMFIDALAAQLVRQVDASDNVILVIDRDRTFFSDDFRTLMKGGRTADDRTMSTIRAIVDSGVLK